jgi:hypothetical protein
MININPKHQYGNLGERGMLSGTIIRLSMLTAFLLSLKKPKRARILDFPWIFLC